ncbi:MAG: glutamine synthetase III [Bacteroidales bacterium]
MAHVRFEALREAYSRHPKEVKKNSPLTSDYYGKLVFSRKKMEKYLSKYAYKAVVDASRSGASVDRRVASEIALGMKQWALENGATHYTHWFHPLTDGTAEKHDAFIDMSEEGGVIEEFSGSLLVQQEPDASSFPNGGIRQTFEARGYTAWDPSSPAFIIGTTLCIPTIFISYTGEALDYKVPLLKSIAALDAASVDVCRYFDKNVSKVNPQLGWEQEYFLVDRALFRARPDLVLTGRTLMGHSSSKDQQLDDHYFGSIPPRVAAFMRNLEDECYKIGIPAKTRHNEVAPNQFELAPIFEEMNLANDHNLILMDIMKRVANEHDFEVLFHEKPFKGVNGSGKHNNWSLITNTGVNLFKPGNKPKANLQFLTFVINTLKAVLDNQDLLRAGILTAGNTHRLGANEAPPSIISVFLGTEVSKMLDVMESAVSDKPLTPDEKTALKLNIGRIPEILLDTTDRNRTSPFAFTGNRFEFRAVGSSANCASALVILNAAMARQLKLFKADVDKLIDEGKSKDDAIFQILKRIIIETKKIRFSGNGYSDEWVEEAKKRGLTNVNSVPEAMDAYMTEHSKELFSNLKIFNLKELEGRTEVEHEKYMKKIQIEARVLGDLAINHIIPTAIKYQTSMVENVKGLKEIFDDGEYEKHATNRKDLIKKMSEHIETVKAGVSEMVNERKKANVIEDVRERAYAYCNNVAPYLDKIRYHIDKLELIVDNEIWPLPKYRELLFTR